MEEVVRIDKFLWAVRVFKTRSEATDACKGNKVKVEGTNAKPSKMIKVGEIIVVRKAAIIYTFKVLKLTENRLGAKLVPEFVENLTPQAELDKLKAPVETLVLKRDRGTGRPTKRDRRQMEEMWDSIDINQAEDLDDPDEA
jgi:ribosome-associated heat shock protein Hsp15